MSEHLPGFGRHVDQERVSARAVELGSRVIDAELREERSPSKVAYARIWTAHGEGSLGGERTPAPRTREARSGPEHDPSGRPPMSRTRGRSGR